MSYTKRQKNFMESAIILMIVLGGNMMFEHGHSLTNPIAWLSMILTFTGIIYWVIKDENWREQDETSN